MAALVAVNVVIFGAVGAVLYARSRPAELVVPEQTVAWETRLAPDATELDAACPGCNLLLVSIDIFRPDHMPCFGYEQPTTPWMCELAENAVVFDNFIVHAYQTPVSLMSMLTGRYPSHSGFTNFAAVLPEEVDYFPEVLKEAGYDTVAMGSSFEVMSDMSAYTKGSLRFRKSGLNPGMSFGRGFDRFIFTGQRNVPTDAVAWLAEPRKAPWLLWLVIGTLHWPYGAQTDPAMRSRFDPPGYNGTFADGKLGFEVLSRIYDRDYYQAQGAPPTPLTEADDAFINSRYDAGMWTVDQFVGDLLANMPPEVMQNTLIVLHGAHGEDLGEHGYYGHYDVFDTEVRSTLMVLSPRRRKEGVRVAAQVEGVDLAPTLLDLLGVRPLNGALGRSVSDWIVAGKGEDDRPAFTQRLPLWEDIFRYRADMPEAYTAQIDPILDRAVYGDTGLRTLKWKLLHRRAREIEASVSWWTWLSGRPLNRPEWELYDLEADPNELVNVAEREPAVVAELSARLLAWERETGADRDELRIPEASAAP